MEKSSYYIEGCNELEKENYEEAIKYFSKALEQNPDDLDSLIKRTDAYSEIGDFDNRSDDLFLQVRLYTKILKKNPDNYEALYERGRKFRQLARYKLAIADFEKAIELNPEYVEPYIGIGGALASYPYFESNKALEYFNQAIQLQPDNSQALHNIGRIYRKQNNIQQAIEYYKKCIDLGGDYSAVSYRCLATIYAKRNQYDKAIRCYRELLKNNIGSCEGYRTLSSYYEQIGDFDNAIFHINIAISIDKKEYYNYFRLARVYNRLGDYNKASEFINTAISVRKTKQLLQYKVKQCFKFKDYEEAEKTFDELQKMWDSHISELQSLAYREGVSGDDIKEMRFK